MALIKYPDVLPVIATVLIVHGIIKFKASVIMNKRNKKKSKLHFIKHVGSVWSMVSYIYNTSQVLLTTQK